jgi:hypothetical protein
VQSGATLTGSGTAGAINASFGGNISPGNSGPGTLTSGNLSLASSAHFNLELGGTAQGFYDQLSVKGSVSLGGDAPITLTNGFTPILGETFFVLLNDGTDPVTGTFSNFAGNQLSVGGWLFNVNYLANGDGGTVGNDISLMVVPEPGTWALCVSGFALLYVRRRASRRRA